MPTAPPPMPPPPIPGYRLWYARQSRVAKVALWLSSLCAVCLIFGVGFGIVRGVAVLLLLVSALPLAVCLLLLFWRWFSRTFLWSVRNRLTLTYLLMGLAPVVLFLSLGAIALYIFAGQYATASALADLDALSKQVKDETAQQAALSSHLIVRREQPSSAFPVAILKNGAWQILAGSAQQTLTPAGERAPAWLTHTFRGIVEKDGQLYLCAVDLIPVPAGTAELAGSEPLSNASLDSIGQQLGVLRIFSHDGGDTAPFRSQPDDAKGVHIKVDQDGQPEQDFNVSDDRSTSTQVALKGGNLPPAASLLDPPIYFSAPIDIYAWNSGAKISSILVVGSRPSLLYGRLFGSSFSGGNVIRWVLLTTAAICALLELFAVLMAIALSRNIVRSVRELYRGTRAVDAGDLDHRVRVTRYDQLGDLARSFNGMAGSIASLLVQQREKDKLLNELSIAQEVQRTLFPQSPASGAGLELHAVCVPALSVGGDYYDFIFGPQNAVCLTLGDISGKGMSAALLMASLHSSIRALSFDTNPGVGPHLSPAALMETINRSLYRSTQSSRYATLFAACYAADSRALTYSNGGHLPPIILCTNGELQRLEAGGPVVGLLPGLPYSEATIQLNSGDLLIAFTDGVTEPEQGAQEFGEQRLIDLILPIRSSPLPTIMATVLEAVKQWIGDREQPDDITLLLARQL